MVDKERNFIERLLGRPSHGYTADEKQELRRNKVRVLVTYAAAVYLFVFGPLVVVCLFNAPKESGNVAAAKDMFMALLPIASGIVAYWFAARGSRDGPRDRPRRDSDSEQDS